MRLASACVAVLLGTGWQTGAAATEPAGLERVREFLESVHSLRADFSQDVINRDLEVVESASGQVHLSRPGRFRWDYRQPFERVIVADGERVWLYEADLDQVTVRRMDESLGTTPAALLTGSIDILDGFEYLGTEQDDELTWVALGPLDDTADFASIRLGFDEAGLTRLILVDRLGQMTHLRFDEVERNPDIDPQVFRFEVPPGADVIGEEEL